MGRPNNLAPRDIDFYYLHRVPDIWAAVHACMRVHEDGEDSFETICGIDSGNISTLDSENTYDSVDAALRSNTGPCELCRRSGAFGTDGQN